MKKIILFNIAALFIASAAFAAASSAPVFTDAGKNVVATGGPATNAAVGKLSTKVALGWKTDPLGYAIITQHQQGTKAYGTSADSTSIYVTDVATGTATDVPGSTGSDSFSTWTTM